MSNKKLVATESSSMAESNALMPVEAAQVEILEELSHDEERDRHRLELRVERAFYQAGKALSELREDGCIAVPIKHLKHTAAIASTIAAMLLT